MSSQSRQRANRSATVALCALLLCAAIAVVAAATAHAAQFKMVACAVSSGAPPYRTETNTVNAQHPNGIFDFANWCGGAGGDPPGDAAYMRISEREAAGNAGEGAYGAFIFETPAYVRFKTGGGYTREPNAFNDGWRARFWGIDFANNGAMFLNQGSGVSNAGTDSSASGIFGPHLWPFGNYLDFHHFYFELRCVRPAGCDRANYNAVDANGFVFILDDDSPSKVSITHTTSPLLSGLWVRGAQTAYWDTTEAGSGMRFERVRVDGDMRGAIDYQAMGQCNATSSQTNGEFSRGYQPCPTGGPWGRNWDFDSASFSDGTHTLSVCTQDYGQYQGLNGSGGETCDSRTIRIDNHAPGAPAGLQIVSSNPARYLDHFGAQFSLPPDPGSPIAKVHYDVIDAAGKQVMPDKVLPGTNPTALADVSGPAKAGEYSLRVWLEDSVGLTGPAAVAPIPHDTTPPAAPQDVSVTAPTTARTAQSFDVRWHNILDGGSPIDAAHYQVLNGAGAVVVPTRSVQAETPQAIGDLDTPRERGSYTLRLWLSDAEGNASAPISVPLAYDCTRSDVGGGIDLTAGLGKRGASSLTVQQRESAGLVGRLTGDAGPVSNAPLCVFSRVVTHQDPQFLGIAMTGTDGRYQFAIGSGPSRELTVAYRPDQRELTAQASLKSRVHPTFRLKGEVVQNKGVAVFKGAIPGPDNGKVVIVLQAKSGKGWRVFRRYSTHRGGRFVMRYRFTQTYTPTTYIMRAQIRGQRGYPYEEGNSRAIPVPVVP
jgi:hypothetical protein